MIPRKTAFVAIILPLFIGLSGLFRVINSPSFATYRAVDVVQLTGSGACFGVALFALILMFRKPNP